MFYSDYIISRINFKGLMRSKYKCQFFVATFWYCFFLQLHISEHPKTQDLPPLVRLVVPASEFAILQTCLSLLRNTANHTFYIIPWNANGRMKDLKSMNFEALYLCFFRTYLNSVFALKKRKLWIKGL